MNGPAFKSVLRVRGLRVVVIVAVSMALPCASAYCRQASPSSEVSFAIRSRLDELAASCNREDLDAYVACFEKRRRATILRQAAPLFTQHALHMEIVDAHVVSAKREHAEVMVKYIVSLTEHKYEIMSSVEMKHSHDAWLVSKETIRTFVEPRRAVSSCMGGGCIRLGGGCPIRSSCSGGRCSLSGP